MLAICTFDRFFLTMGAVFAGDGLDLMPWLQKIEEVWNSLLSIEECPRGDGISRQNRIN